MSDVGEEAPPGPPAAHDTDEVTPSPAAELAVVAATSPMRRRGLVVVAIGAAGNTVLFNF